MRIDDRVLKTIVFVGTQPNQLGQFVAHGTGFIAISFVEDMGFQSIVTAKHVIDRIRGDEVCIRVNTHGGEARILQSEKSAWIPHPNKGVDLSVCPAGVSKEVFDIMHMPIEGDMTLTKDTIESQYIGIGDEVFVVGMYVARLGETKNIPIARTGTIAAMADEKIKTEYGYHDAYLIEVRSIDGLSGSPVFVHRPPWQIRDGKPKLASGLTQYFMGILLGYAAVHDTGDIVSIEQPSDRASRKGAQATVYLNTGIGIVLPAHYIGEAINQPAILEKRMASLNARSDSNRHCAPTSTSPEAPLPEVGNASHAEDFKVS